MAETYERQKVQGGGSVLGNDFHLNYEGANKCPKGYIWVGGYQRRNGLFGKVYVAGHCRKITEGGEVEDRPGGLL